MHWEPRVCLLLPPLSRKLSQKPTGCSSLLAYQVWLSCALFAFQGNSMSQSTRSKYKSLHWNVIRTPLLYSLINGLLHGHFSPRNCKIIILNFILWRDFSHSSVGKESACIAGLIPGSGRSSGEGIDYPLQYAWASLVAQLVKNLPATWEAWVPSRVWEGTINLLYWTLYW